MPKAQRISMSPAPQHPTVQPPRPPNAWILFRSDMSRKIPGERRPQSDVSKAISHMWNNAAPEVRAEYERRAEQKKAEHAIKYPNYRFQPKKKEDKDKAKDEKKAKVRKISDSSRKTRAKASATPSPATPMPYAPSFYPLTIPDPSIAQLYYPPNSVYGPLGPSPPISAAASPAPSASFDHRFAVQSTPLDAFRLSEALVASSSASTSQSTIDAMTPLSYGVHESPRSPASPPSVHSPPQFNSSGLAMPSPEHQVQGSYLSASPSSGLWYNSQQMEPSNSMQLGWHQANDTSDQFSNDICNFNLPDINQQSWGNLPYNDMQGFLHTTGDPDVFHLSWADGMNPPSGELELTVGELNSSLNSDLALYDFTHPYPSPADSLIHGGAPMNNTFQNYGPYEDVIDPLLLQRSQPQISSANVSPPSSSESLVPSAPQSPAHSNRYIPPPGARHAANRRVAASWKASQIDKGLDPTPPRVST